MAITSTITKTSHADGSAAWYLARFSAVLADYASAAALTGYATPGLIFPNGVRQVFATEKIKDASCKVQVSMSTPSQIDAGVAVWQDLTVDSGGAGTNTKAGTLSVAPDATGKDQINGVRLYFASALAASTYDMWVIGVPKIDDGKMIPTPEGGYCLPFLSDTGADSVIGQGLTVGTVDGSLALAPTSGKECYGVSQVAGIPTGGYILVNPMMGKSYVLLEAATASVLGHILTTSAITAGRFKSIAAPALYAAPDVVMRCGQPLEANAGGANVTILAVLGR